MKENVNNQKPAYKAPEVYGVKESEATVMAANRYMNFNSCCMCSGAGSSRT